jgi:hypothetical protein
MLQPASSIRQNVLCLQAAFGLATAEAVMQATQEDPHSDSCIKAATLTPHSAYRVGRSDLKNKRLGESGAPSPPLAPPLPSN